MIAASTTTGQLNITGDCQRARWQQVLADAVTGPAELCEILGLDPALIAPALQAAEGFPLRVPRGFVARMRRGDPHDPLLLQVLPVGGRTEHGRGFQPGSGR